MFCQPSSGASRLVSDSPGFSSSFLHGSCPRSQHPCGTLQVSRSNAQIKKEFKMTAGNSNEMGTDGALGQNVTAWSRPLLVGALAAGVIALGASIAVAASPVGSPSSGPSTAWGHGTNTSMMSGTSMGMMLGTTARMMTTFTRTGTMPHASTRMMSRTSTTTPRRTGTGTGTGTGTTMMSGTSTATPPATGTGTGTDTRHDLLSCQIRRQLIGRARSCLLYT